MKIQDDMNNIFIGKKISIDDTADLGRNNRIIAEKIIIRKNVSLGNNIDIHIKGEFSIDENSRLGSNAQIRGNNIHFGKHLFNSGGLRIGGGGRQHPNANFSIGDRCTIHNNFINVCETVEIGDDVGLSPDTSILTHGYWLSVLEGYPARFAGVKIEDGVIVGYRSLIMMGVIIGKNAVIGAGSLVTKDVEPNSIYGGNPARLLKRIEEPTREKKKELVEKIISEYKKIAVYHEIKPIIKIEYPNVIVNDCIFNVVTSSVEGDEDEVTDDFRDYVRKWGLRFFTERPFRSKFDFYKEEVEE